MAGQPATPTNMIVQQANRQILVSWDLSVGSTSYEVDRSEDNVTYTNISTVSGSPLATSYLDTAVTVGTGYWYRVRAVNGSGNSQYTPVYGPIVPTPTGEMSLGQLRLEAQQTADRVNSNFVTKSEWNSFIRLAMYELYDLLITTYEDYYLAAPASFVVNGSSAQYDLPNGLNTFLTDNNVTFTPKPFYKLMGVDLALQNSPNGYVTVSRYNFADRNRFVYPNTASTIYGVFNLQYRPLGDKIMFIPTPSANQVIRLWYIPRLTELLADTDTTDVGISGWLRYVIVRAAIYALVKEESDTTKLEGELVFLKQRIEESASNRDAGQPDTISNSRRGSDWNGGGGAMGPSGGF